MRIAPGLATTFGQFAWEAQLATTCRAVVKAGRACKARPASRGESGASGGDIWAKMKGRSLGEAERIIARLGLVAHPEGGWYRQTWIGPGKVRASGTAILFLLARGDRSHWHRVDADEIWLFHAGAPLMLSLAETETACREVLLGPDVLAGDAVQGIVPAGWWQAARSTGDWSLVSCTVSPGFRFAGFELAPPGFDIPVAQ